MNHPAIEGPWSQRALNVFLTRYGHGWHDEKPLEMRQKLWRLHVISGFAGFGPGYACHTTLPVMVCAWDRCYQVIGQFKHPYRGDVCRIASNRNGRFQHG